MQEILCMQIFLPNESIKICMLGRLLSYKSLVSGNCYFVIQR